MAPRCLPLRTLTLVAVLALATQPAPATTPTPSVTPTGDGLGRLVVHVAEHPAGCQGAMRGVSVTLRPLAITRRTSLDDGNVEFTVPPGSYTLQVEFCSPFGCWPERVVDVTAGDQYVTLCPLAFTPSPTPTATPTPEPTGALGEKTTELHVFNLVSALPIAGAPYSCSSPRDAVSGVADNDGNIACTLQLRDADTILIHVEAPGFADRRRGYRGIDLWQNQDVLQVGMIPDGLCGGDCNGDHAITVDELVRAVGFVLADGSAPGCPLADIDGDGRVAVNDVVAGVTRALVGCPTD
ncbi:MAG: hypothetical protein SF182_18250 [Deltaproteobacteria bacterium]|nr:hypothetical protein [Deltaproteobacteria bacterium]